MSDVTRLLDAAAAGDRQAAADLLPLVYDELRKLAAARMAGRVARPHPPADRPGPRGVPPAGRAGRRRSAGTAAATSSPPPPRPCAASSSTPPAASGAEKHGGDFTRRDLDPDRPAAPEPSPTTCSPWTRPSTGSPPTSPGRRRAGQAPLLRRADRRGGRRRPRHLAPNGRPPTGPTPGPGSSPPSATRAERGRRRKSCRFRCVIRTPSLALGSETPIRTARAAGHDANETSSSPPLDLPDPAARAAYLDGACGGDAGLRARVEALLRAHDRPDSFLGTPGGRAARPGPRRHPGLRRGRRTRDGRRTTGGETDAPTTSRSAFLAPPTRPDSLGRLGHYEVLEVLGQGGFGIVFRAFDDVLQRVVAVKVLAPQTGRHVAGPQAVPARGPVVRPGPPRERRAGLRGRRAAAAVPGDGVHPRRDAPAAARPDRPARRAGGAADRPADRRGAGRRPRHAT